MAHPKPDPVRIDLDNTWSQDVFEIRENGEMSFRVDGSRVWPDDPAVVLQIAAEMIAWARWRRDRNIIEWLAAEKAWKRDEAWRNSIGRALDR